MLFTCLAVLNPPSPTMVPVNLTVEALADTPTIDVPNPRFAWKLKAKDPKAKNLTQSAYRIIVASTPEKLKANQGDLWDSGRVKSNQQLEIPYKGKPLTSNKILYWKVQSTDQSNASEWSKPATFHTGLYNKSDWHNADWISAPNQTTGNADLNDAKWIWTDEPSGLAEAATHTFVKKFSLDQVPDKATLIITADDQFTATLNGQTVTGSDGKAEAWKRPVSQNVAKLLKKGENILEIKATNAEKGSAALIASLTAKNLHFTTDDSWSVNGKTATVRGAYGIAPWGRISVGPKIGPPASYFHKSIDTPKKVKRATAFVTALGLVDFTVNNKRVSEDLFTPGWTDYETRVYYRSYDITAHLKQGANTLGAVLGDGWYSGYLGYSGTNGHYGSHPMFKAVTVIEFTDGTTKTIVTDKSWLTSQGPTINQDFLMGETFDSRVSPTATQKHPVTVEKDKGLITQSFRTQPVRPYKTLKPVKITKQGKSYILDYGQNLAGFAQTKLSGPAGQEVHLQFIEVLNPDGTPYLINLRGARAHDIFICNGKASLTWTPRFTFHGFRYIQVTGLDHEPKPEEIQAVAISTATPETGSVKTSDPMINKLASNAWWTQKMNFIDIPTDCPQRDERLGWTGDAQAYIRTASYYSDVQSFFDKWLDALDDSQRPDGQYPMVAPVKVAGDDGGPAWADAGTVCPWAVYEMFGDKDRLARSYPGMKKFVDFCKNRSKPDLLPPDEYHCFGDWVSINANTPNDVIYTSYFAGSARIVAHAAKVLGKTEDAKTYNDLADKVKAAFNKAYVTDGGHVKGETQTGYVLALGFDLLEPATAKQAADLLVENIKDRGWHLSTGFVGTRDLMHVLSKIGRNDVAFRLLHNKTFPSWGFSIENGATTIWERWDGWTPEKGFQDPGMNSFAHYAYGAVMQWVFENIGGIKPAAPGFEKVQVAPAIDPNLTWADTSFESRYGTIKSRWETKGGKLTLTTTIPPNTTALIFMPKLNNRTELHVVGSGTHTYTTPWK